LFKPRFEPLEERRVLSFIGGLDLVSESSNFERGSQVSLPAAGWSNVVSTAMIYDDPGLNGALIATDSAVFAYANYEVQYSTGVAIQANTRHTLHFDMGFYAERTDGVANYNFQLGTLDGSLTFSPVGYSASGAVSYAGNIGSGNISGSDNLVFATGASVSGDILAVRWAQTGTTGFPYSDFFGFDNVTLDASPVTLPPFVVTTASDLADGDTSSIDALRANRGADGAISLREAILAANNTPGHDEIGFSIPGEGAHTIAPLTPLPDDD
jgi:hypothetical protein